MRFRTGSWASIPPHPGRRLHCRPAPTVPSAGTYYLRARHFSATSQLRPYALHFRMQTGAPMPESEPNDSPATANPLPGNGWVSGARDAALATEQDWFSFTANAGDTVFLSLDLDPERTTCSGTGASASRCSATRATRSWWWWMPRVYGNAPGSFRSRT